jgi:ABC-type phosphate/phosphonate transport system substrate-binding protein
MNFSRLLEVRNIGCQIAAMVLLLAHCALANADLILTSPPREKPADGQKQYGPLAEQLSKVLGVKVVYEHPKGWLYYQRDMRLDKYDIIFDGPHFISWRVKQFNQVPVAKLPGTLSFVLFTKKDNKDVTKLEDLYNKPVCGIAPPNLATLTVLAQFPNPVRQPRLVTVKGGAPGVYKAFASGKCVAAILRDKFYMKKIPETVRAGFNVIFHSLPVTNQGFSVSSRVTPEQREKIVKYLTADDNKELAPTLKRFGGKAKKMIPTSAADYENQYRLLTGIIFGWEITNPDFVDPDKQK